MKRILDLSEKYHLKSLFSYLIVGGGATIVEWLVFHLLNKRLQVHYLAATVIAIVISTFSNWLFGRLLTFRHAPKGNLWAEIGKIYVISIAGLGLNLLLMWIMVGGLHWDSMLSKIAATGIVFMYNYLIRIKLVYKSK